MNLSKFYNSITKFALLLIIIASVLSIHMRHTDDTTQYVLILFSNSINDFEGRLSRTQPNINTFKSHGTCVGSKAFSSRFTPRTGARPLPIFADKAMIKQCQLRIELETISPSDFTHHVVNTNLYSESVGYLEFCSTRNSRSLSAPSQNQLASVTQGSVPSGLCLYAYRFRPLHVEHLPGYNLRVDDVNS
jgi:hypothetical protein